MQFSIFPPGQSPPPGGKFYQHQKQTRFLSSVLSKSNQNWWHVDNLPDHLDLIWEENLPLLLFCLCVCVACFPRPPWLFVLVCCWALLRFSFPPPPPPLCCLLPTSALLSPTSPRPDSSALSSSSRSSIFSTFSPPPPPSFLPQVKPSRSNTKGKTKKEERPSKKKKNKKKKKKKKNGNETETPPPPRPIFFFVLVPSFVFTGFSESFTEFYRVLPNFTGRAVPNNNNNKKRRENRFVDSGGGVWEKKRRKKKKTVEERWRWRGLGRGGAGQLWSWRELADRRDWRDDTPEKKMPCRRASAKNPVKLGKKPSGSRRKPARTK